MKIGMNSLTNLAQIRKDVKRKRVSSYDKTGANADFLTFKGNDIREICNIEGAGMIKHIWMTIASGDPYYLRKTVIRMWWDNEEHPSVECPIGDFFGLGHAKTVNFWSLPLSMGPEDGKGFNCFFPMPFSERARIEIENESDTALVTYFYIDYEEYDTSRFCKKISGSRCSNGSAVFPRAGRQRRASHGSGGYSGARWWAYRQLSRCRGSTGVCAVRCGR